MNFYSKPVEVNESKDSFFHPRKRQTNLSKFQFQSWPFGCCQLARRADTAWQQVANATLNTEIWSEILVFWPTQQILMKLSPFLPPVSFSSPSHATFTKAFPEEKEEGGTFGENTDLNAFNWFFYLEISEQGYEWSG